MSYADTSFHCLDCSRPVNLSANDQRTSDELGYQTPERCHACRRLLEEARGPATAVFGAILTPDLALDHTHHWLIAGQNGPSSEGTCKDCGLTRDFKNSYVRTYRTPMFLGHRAKRASI